MTIFSGNGPAPFFPKLNDTWVLTDATSTSLSDSKACQLILSGVPGQGLDNAPGLQKEFNENSRAGEKAGRKK